MKDDNKKNEGPQESGEVEKKKAPETVLKPGMKHGDHILNSRRDFLSQGLITGTAFGLMPSFLDMMVSKAVAADPSCVFVDNFPRLTPIIILDLAGGANFMGANVAVGGKGGQLNRFDGANVAINYNSLGVADNLKPSDAKTDLSLGLAFHSNSPMLEGIKAAAAPAVLNKVEGMIYCTTSENDTANNLYNPAYWLFKAGARGKLAGLGGTDNSTSGGNSQAAGGINPAAAPVQLVSANDARGLTSLGKLADGFSAANKNDKIDKILRAVSGMSDKKLDSINRRNLPATLQQIVSCNISLTPDQIKTFTPDALDPSKDATVKAAFPGAYTAAGANGPDGDQRRVSTLAKLVLDGYIGVGTVEMGGYDYHLGNQRFQSDAKDKNAGLMIGRIMSLARAKGQSVFIIVLTDGGVAANNDIDVANEVDDKGVAIPNDTGSPLGRHQWGGDNGERSSSLMFLYQHSASTAAARPEMFSGQGDKLRQIGWIKKDGANDGGALLTSNSTVNTAKSMVLNYLSYHGQMDQALNVMGDVPMFNDIAKYVGFAPKKV